MKNMNYKTWVAIGVIAIGVMTACTKEAETEEPCPYTGAPPVNILLDIRDGQGRDLLSPATPGHYDTAQIRQLNPGVVLAVASVQPKQLNRLTLGYQIGEHTAYLKLSSTDEDTLYTVFADSSTRCTRIHRLRTFKYNGKILTDSLKKYFTVVK